VELRLELLVAPLKRRAPQQLDHILVPPLLALSAARREALLLQRQREAQERPVALPFERAHLDRVRGSGVNPYTTRVNPYI